MGDFDSIDWLIECGTSANLRCAKQAIDSALRRKINDEAQLSRNFEYGIALKDKGFGCIFLEVPALGIKEVIQINDGEHIEDVAMEIIRKHFEDDIFSLYDENYLPPAPDFAINFHEYDSHAWKFVKVFTPVSPKINEIWCDDGDN